MTIIDSFESLDSILEEYFWRFVDAGVVPEQTPLLTKSEDNSFVLHIASQYKLDIKRARSLLKVAFLTVA